MGLNDGQLASVVLCDLTKAFDCVCHETLLAKLERYGFRGCILNWFKSYLSERSQVVRFCGSHSDEGKLSVGVPQDSVLGPVLIVCERSDLGSKGGKMRLICL